MSISKINNSFTFSAAQNNLRSFKSTKNQAESETQNASSYPKLTQEELYQLASNRPKKVLNEVAKNTLKTIIIGVPLVDSIFSGIVKNGSLAQKTSKSVKTLGKWGLIFGAGAAVLGIKKIVNSRSETLDNFDKDHRLLSLGIDAAVFYWAINGVMSLKDKGASFVKNLLPDSVNEFKTKLKEPVKRFLDSSYLNKKVILPFEKFVTKKPYFRPALKGVSMLLAPAIAVAAFCRVCNESKKQQENVIINYSLLNYINNIKPENE